MPGAVNSAPLLLLGKTTKSQENDKTETQLKNPFRVGDAPGNSVFGQIVMSFETWVSGDVIANGGKQQTGIFNTLFTTLPIPMLQANERL